MPKRGGMPVRHPHEGSAHSSSRVQASSSVLPLTAAVKTARDEHLKFALDDALTRIERKVVFRQRLPSVKGCLPSSVKGVFCQRLSSSNVVFRQMSSSIKCRPLGRFPSKVVFHQRSSSVKGCLPSKVVFHQKSSSIKGRLPSKVVFHQS